MRWHCGMYGDKSILVTGAAGFLGSHLCQNFLERGYNVVAVDNLSSGFRRNLPLHERLIFFEHDVVKDWDFVDEIPILWLEEMEYVFHLASLASPRLYQAAPMETLLVNSFGLEQAIRFSDRWRARLIFSSSSEVYGEPLTLPQREMDYGLVNTTGPRSCYTEAKRFGESFIYHHNLCHGTNHGIVRIFNTYGPRMNPNDGRVIINFLFEACMKRSITVYGDGTQTRSFCFVDDLIDGLVRYAESGLVEPINLGNDSEITVLQLANELQSLFSEKIQVEFGPRPIDEPQRRRPDVTLARQKLGWSARTPLQEGLRKTLAWLQDLLAQ